MRRAILFLGPLAALLLSVLAVPAAAAPAETAVGSQRAVFARKGTAIVETPDVFAKAVKLLPYGTRVKVEELKGDWARVTEYKGRTAAATGWLLVNKTVEPHKLTHGGQFASRDTGRGSRRISQRDTVAAGRQFDKTSEAKHKQVSSEALKRAYAALDKLVEAIKPTTAEVRKFVSEGRLKVAKKPAAAPAKTEGAKAGGS